MVNSSHVSVDSRKSARLARLSVASLILASTALAPVSAQTLDLGGANVVRNELVVGGPFTIIRNGTLTFVPDVPNAPHIFGGQLTDGAGGFTLVKQGTGDLTLTGTSNDFTGLTTVSNGGLIAGATNTFSPNSILNPNSLGIARLNNFDQTVAGLLGSGRVSNVGPTVATLTIDGSTNNNFTGVVAGALQLVKNGSGRQGLLTGVNTYTGGTILNAGELRFGNSSSFGTGSITVNGDGTARLSVNNAGVVIANDVIMNADTTFVTAGSNTRFTGIISGSGALIKDGDNQLRLGGANTYGGGTDWLLGRIRVDSDLALGTGEVRINTNNVTLVSSPNASLTLANNFIVNRIMNVILPTAGNILTLSGNISGTGSIAVEVDQAGMLVLSGNNGGHSGGVALANGRIGVTRNNSLGTGQLSFETGGIGLQARADNLVIANTIAARNTVEIDTQGNTLTLSGGYSNRLGDPAGLRKLGTGTLIFSGNKTYTGPTLVDEGVLRLNGTMGSNITVAAGASLTGSGSTTGAVTIANGATLAPGNSPGTMSYGSLVLNNASILNFELQNPAIVGGGVNDLINVTTNLTLDGILNVTPLPGFSLGTFRLFNYGGALTNNIVTLGAPAPVDVGYEVNVDTPNQVNLIVTYTGEYNWDGANAIANGTIDGGDGIWSLAGTNWTNSDGTFNLAWGNVAGGGGSVANFGAPAGDVTVDGALNFRELNFLEAGYTLTGGSLNMDGGIIDTVAGLTTIDSVLTGINGLQKTGAGELVLNGANSYAGGTALDAGTILAGSDTALGIGTLSMADGTVLKASGRELVNDIAITGAGTVDVLLGGTTLSGVISGGALVVLSSDGTAEPDTAGLILTGTNTYIGGTTIDGVSVVIDTDANLGDAAGALAIDSGRLVTNADITMNRATTLTTFGEFDVAGATTLTKNGVIDGDGELVKLSDGTLVLGNALNSFAGDVVIQGGTVSVGSEGALGAGNIRFEELGGTLELTAGITTAKTVLLAADGTIDTVVGDSTFSGVISGVGSLTKEGPAQLTLTGVNTYEGGTFLNEGLLRIDNDSSIGTGTLTTQDSTVFVAGLAPTNAVITLANEIVLETGTTVIDLVGSFGIVDQTEGGLLFTDGTTLTLDGPISGVGGWVSQNSGTVILNGDNSYEGGTELSRTLVLVGSDTALGTGLVTLNNVGSVQNMSGGALSLANDFLIDTSGGFAAVIGGNDDLTLTGNIGGTGILSKTGDGTTVLSGAANDFAGTLNVRNGTLQVDGAFTDAALVTEVGIGTTLSGTGTLTGTVNMANFSTLSPGNSPGLLTIDGDLNLLANTLLSWELGQAYALGGALNDQMIVTGNLQLDGLLNVSESLGGAFTLGVYNLFTYGTLTDNGLTIQGALPNGLTGFVQNNAAASQINLIVTAPGTFVQYWDGADFVGNGNIDGGAGSWTTAGTNWTGSPVDPLADPLVPPTLGGPPSDLNTSWQPNSVAVFQGETGAISVEGDFTFQGLQFLTDGHTLGNGGGSLEIGSPQSFIYTEAGVTTTIGTLLTGEGQLLKQGAGNLVLSFDNTYSGGTLLQLGTITVGGDLALGTGDLEMLDGTSLVAGEAGITLANNVITNGVGTVDSGTGSFTLDGEISGAGSILKAGEGTLVLTSANSYAGGTELTDGTLDVRDSLALGTGTLTVTGSGTTLLAGADALVLENAVQLDQLLDVNTQAFTMTLNGDIAGAGAVRKGGLGNLILNGDNSYNGLSIDFGTVTLGTNTAGGSGTIDLLGVLEASDVTLAAGVEGLIIANNVGISGGFNYFDTNGFTFTLEGVISDLFGNPGTLIKEDAGTLVLNAANTYTGGTLLTEGVIEVGDDEALGTGDLTMSTDTTLSAGADGLMIVNDIETLGAGLVASNGFIFTLNGTISGAGSISHVTDGNLVLNGDNSFTNLGINVGTVTLGSDTAAGIGNIALAQPGSEATLAVNTDVTIINDVQTLGTGLVASNGFVFTINGNIGGPGSISHITAGNLVLNGDNSFTNLGINAGTVTLGTDTAAGIGDIAIASGATLASGASVTIANDVQTLGTGLVETNGFEFTLNGDVAGPGSISHIGSGNLVLNGDNSFVNLGINNGTVTVGSDTAAGIGDIAIASGTTLANNKDVTLANNVQTLGTGLVDVQAGTVMILNGDISSPVLMGGTTFVGQWQVDDGPSWFGSPPNGPLAYTGQEAAALLFGGNPGDYVISTLGTDPSLINFQAWYSVIGFDDALFAQDYSAKYLGQFYGPTSGYPSGDPNAAASAYVDDNATGPAFTNYAFLAGGGIPGSISQIGGGNLVLNGNNSFVNLGINNGTVTLGSDTAAGVGDISIASGTTLGANKDVTIANNIQTLGTGLVASNGFTFTWNGDVGGAGSISHVTGGNLVLNGDNSFTNLGINVGTVTLGSDTAAGIGDIAIAQPGGEATLGANTDVTIANNVQTLGTGLVASNGNTFTWNGDVSGAGSISHVTDGNLVLNGNNSFVNLGINVGTVTLGSDTAAGIGDIAIAQPGGEATLGANASITITNNIQTLGTALIASNGNTFTINGRILGAGSISHVTDGNLVLNGDNSYTNLGINAGTVTLGANTAGGIGDIAINNGATLASGAAGLVLTNQIVTTATGLIASNGNTFTLNGRIIGPGSISHVSGGNLVLNGNNAFTNLGINAGTVTLGSNTAGGIADIAINNGATLASGAVGLVITNQIVTTATGLIASNGNTFTLNGRIIGPGSISHVSGGNLVLNGNNAFTNLGINAGTVTLGSNTAGGVADIAINSGATLAAGVSGLVVANQIVTTGAATVNSGTGTFTLSGRIIGPGGLTKTGSGLLTLTGSGSGYTGATTVAAGELRVNSAIATSAFTVQSGARLSGTGTLGGLTVQSGGTVAPGTSPGTLNVAGPVTFLAGSTYAAEVTPTAADRITATGALSLNGTLAVAASGSFTSFNQTFTVASGSSRTGTFSSVTGLAGFGAPFNPLVEYTGTLVNVRLAPASLVGLAGSGLGPNALEVARAFDRAVAGGFNPQGFFGLYTQGANLGNVLGQLSGETYAAQRRVAMEDTRVIRETAFDRLNSGVGSADGNTRTASTSGAEAETTVWLRGVGSWGTAKADGVGSRFTTEQLGVLTGLDYAKGGFKVGAAFTYTQNDIESVAGDARVKSTGGALYAGYADPSGFKIGAGGSVAGTRSTNNRSVIIAPAVQSLRGSVDGTTYQLFGELAYDIAAGPTTQVTPFARYAYVNHRANAFTETGGNAAVSGVRESTDISVITAGLRAAFSIGENAKVTGSAGYQNITGDRAGNATLALTGLNQPMNIRAVALDKDSAALEARADFRIGANATLGVGYSGVIGSNNQDHGARATLTFGF